MEVLLPMLPAIHACVVGASSRCTPPRWGGAVKNTVLEEMRTWFCHSSAPHTRKQSPFTPAQQQQWRGGGVEGGGVSRGLQHHAKFKIG